jgi:hypothetical protein
MCWLLASMNRAIIFKLGAELDLFLIAPRVRQIVELVGHCAHPLLQLLVEFLQHQSKPAQFRRIDYGLGHIRSLSRGNRPEARA